MQITATFRKGLRTATITLDGLVMTSVVKGSTVRITGSDRAHAERVAARWFDRLVADGWRQI